jgi:hypothetical protein
VVIVVVVEVIEGRVQGGGFFFRGRETDHAVRRDAREDSKGNSDRFGGDVFYCVAVENNENGLDTGKHCRQGLCCQDTTGMARSMGVGQGGGTAAKMVIKIVYC